MMASSFNRASHYQKMHDALKRVGSWGGSAGAVGWLQLVLHCWPVLGQPAWG